ncbi:MAG: hypothetical protein O2944_01980 [Proteobacteria bacterium]|nr:hypothetical protein [Pseudomonadota bacterium]
MPNTDSIILTKDSVVPEPFTAPFLHWIEASSGRHAVFQSIRQPISDGGEDVRPAVSAVSFQKLNSQHYEYYGTDPKFR